MTEESTRIKSLRAKVNKLAHERNHYMTEHDKLVAKRQRDLRKLGDLHNAQMDELLKILETGNVLTKKDINTYKWTQIYGK